MKLSDYKLFHGQTLFVLSRNPSPAQTAPNLSEHTPVRTALDACFALLQEEGIDNTEETANIKDSLVSLLTKLSQKYVEMSHELIACANLLSRPENTTHSAHWKDLAAFRRKAFVTSEVSNVVSSILYGLTLATSAAIAQGQHQSQFIIPQSIRLTWSKTFDSFGQVVSNIYRNSTGSQSQTSGPGSSDAQNQTRNSPSSNRNDRIDNTGNDSLLRTQAQFPEEVFANIDLYLTQRTNESQLNDIIEGVLDASKVFAQGFRRASSSSLTLDKYFHIPVESENVFYEILSRITISDALQIVTGSVQKLDDSLLILKQLLRSRSTELNFYLVNQTLMLFRFP